MASTYRQIVTLKYLRLYTGGKRFAPTGDSCKEVPIENEWERVS